MEKNQVKIKIDPNGNVHREIIEQPQTQPQKAKFLKRLATAFNLSAV